jgi:hypothetical protein
VTESNHVAQEYIRRSPIPALGSPRIYSTRLCAFGSYKLSELQGANHVTGYFKLVRDTDAARAEFQRFQQLAALG